MLCFQTLFVDNTNACEQRETVRRGQAEVRGGEERGGKGRRGEERRGFWGSRRGDNEGARVHWPKTKAGHQKRGKSVISWSKPEIFSPA